MARVYEDLTVLVIWGQNQKIYYYCEKAIWRKLFQVFQAKQIFKLVFKNFEYFILLLDASI